VKSPAEFTVGTVRLFGVGYGNPAMFVPVIRNLGQNLFYPPNVKGWPGGSTWINSTTLLARKQFVDQLFRSTAPVGNMMAGAAKPGANSMRFDLDGWLAALHTSPQAYPSVTTELQLQHAVLPLAPLAAIDEDSTSGAYLRTLLMDPAYQLK
jgi:uncharacterized protein (DUF1800 family)